MKLVKNLFYFLLLLLLFSCTKKIDTKSIINEKSLDAQVMEAYKQGLENLERGDALYAANKFNEAELLFPQSEWAPRAALMAAYSYYSQDYYLDAIAETERFIRLYPLHQNIDYAYYLTAISYYEQIVDEKKDLESITKARRYFNHVLTKYPNTDYGIDSKFKLDLIDDILASKEMYIGRYYFEKKKWIAAINRFRTVIDNYETTIYTEEAIFRLVEIYYILGLKDEAEKYAKLLGYNYQSSDWYEKSYALFDKTYELRKKSNSKEKNKILTKLKSLLAADE